MTHTREHLAADAGALLVAAESTPGIDPAVTYELVAALGWVGAPPPAGASPLASALFDAQVHGELAGVLALPGPDRADALLLLADACGPARAPAITRALEAAGEVPIGPNLAAALAVADGDASDRLIDAMGRRWHGGIHADAVVGRRPPAGPRSRRTGSAPTCA